MLRDDGGEPDPSNRRSRHPTLRVRHTPATRSITPGVRTGRTFPTGGCLAKRTRVLWAIARGELGAIGRPFAQRFITITGGTSRGAADINATSLQAKEPSITFSTTPVTGAGPVSV